MLSMLQQKLELGFCWKSILTRAQLKL